MFATTSLMLSDAQILIWDTREKGEGEKKIKTRVRLNSM